MKIRVTMTGTSPLLMHSDRLSDPLNPYSKALKAFSSKRTKTDDDHAQMARVEWEGGAYHDPTIGPYIPAANVHRSLVEGARLTKRGRHVERGLVPAGDGLLPLLYDGPRDLEGLYADGRFVSRMSAGVNAARVMRTRPIFPSWSLEMEAIVDPGQLDLEEISTIAEQAGSMVGICDFRPRYGRFVSTVEEI